MLGVESDIYILKVFASINFLCSSSCNPLIEDYTQIFSMIEEEDISSIQYKTSLGGLNLREKYMA
jgi:hypothetical protein